MISAAKELGMGKVLVLGDPWVYRGDFGAQGGIQGPLLSWWCHCSSRGPRQAHPSLPPVCPPYAITSSPVRFTSKISQLCPYLSTSATSTLSQLPSLSVNPPACLHDIPRPPTLLFIKTRVRSFFRHRPVPVTPTLRTFLTDSFFPQPPPLPPSSCCLVPSVLWDGRDPSTLPQGPCTSYSFHLQHVGKKGTGK